MACVDTYLPFNIGGIRFQNCVISSDVSGDEEAAASTFCAASYYQPVTHHVGKETRAVSSSIPYLDPIDERAEALMVVLILGGKQQGVPRLITLPPLP